MQVWQHVQNEHWQYQRSAVQMVEVNGKKVWKRMPVWRVMFVEVNVCGGECLGGVLVL